MTSRRVFLSQLAAATLPSAAAPPTVFELRNYATVPEGRDALIELFERVLLDVYEAGGAQVLGTFCDLADRDRWVWIRAFADGAQRGTALRNFYGSAEWQQYRDAANATIADTSNALLLRLVTGQIDAAAATPSSPQPATSVIECEIYRLQDGAEAHFAQQFTRIATPLLQDMGGVPFATFLPDRSHNSYPRQPIRTDSVFVVLTRFADRAACERHTERRRSSTAWQRIAASALAPLQSGTVTTLRLAPTSRSRIR